jgi:hypothetical protein
MDRSSPRLAVVPATSYEIWRIFLSYFRSPASLKENANNVKNLSVIVKAANNKKTLPVIYDSLKVKNAKAVPQDATKALGGRGGIAPTHSRPRH